MPKSKEQKRQEANDRLVERDMRDIVSSVYNYCPGGYSYRCLVKEQHSRNYIMAQLQDKLEYARECILACNHSSKMPLKDYIDGIFNRFSCGSYPLTSVAEDLLDAKMIEWARKQKMFNIVGELSPKPKLYLILKIQAPAFLEEFKQYINNQ